MGDGAAVDAVDWIELCNVSASGGCGVPVAASSEAYTGYTDAGLIKQAGSVDDMGNGNFSVAYTFTANRTASTNVTHLLNGNGDEFAGNSFTLVSLENNDQITINWTVSIS
ncbi:hypothetical protein LCGC14_2020450 [marine sediment metagenome]|uniref:Uncharacterized protein n=1 Tax=marine sediment metagenome TaxID=412755 RepID=A0A0F9HB00_9ZZZZ